MDTRAAILEGLSRHVASERKLGLLGPAMQHLEQLDRRGMLDNVYRADAFSAFLSDDDEAEPSPGEPAGLLLALHVYNMTREQEAFNGEMTGLGFLDVATSLATFRSSLLGGIEVDAESDEEAFLHWEYVLLTRLTYGIEPVTVYDA